MKKYFVYAFLLGLTFFMFGCGVNTLSSVSKQINTYNFDIVYNDQEKKLEVVQTLIYKNKTDYTFEELCFHLYPNAFREGSLISVVSLNSHTSAYSHGTSYGSIEIISVKNENNTDFNYELSGYDENILQVNLGNKLFPEETIKIIFEFEVFLPNVNHRFGYGDNAINVANFYPIACVYENGEFMKKPYSSNGDPFYSDVANYDVTISYPAYLTLASTGKQDKTSLNDDYKTTTISANAVRDFAFVMSEKFEVIQAEFEHTKVYYYYYSDDQAEKSLQTSVLAIKTYSELFGKYPYSTLSVVKTNFVHGGMEYPNLVYISDSLLSYKDYTNVIIHEIAHQWWYNLVGSNAYDNAWQDEGLTDYSTALFYEFNPEYEVDIETIMENGLKTYSFYTQVYSAVYKTLDTSMNRSLDDFTNENEYVYIAYVKGMLFFDSLRKLIGDTDFFAGLNLYLKTYSFKNAQPYDLIWAFERVTNMKLESFFSSWIEGKVILISNVA